MKTSCCVWAIKLCLLRKASDDWIPVKSRTRIPFCPQKLPPVLVRVSLVMQGATQRAWQHYNCSDKAVSSPIKVPFYFYGVYLLARTLGQSWPFRFTLSREQINLCIWADRCTCAKGAAYSFSASFLPRWRALHRLGVKHTKHLRRLSLPSLQMALHHDWIAESFGQKCYACAMVLIPEITHFCLHTKEDHLIRHYTHRLVQINLQDGDKVGEFEQKPAAMST